MPASAMASQRQDYYTLEVAGAALQSKPSSLNVAVKVLAVVAAFALGLANSEADSLRAATSLALAPTSVRPTQSIGQPAPRPRAPQFDPLQEVTPAGEAEDANAWGPATVAAGVAAGQLLGRGGEASASLAQGRTAALLHPASM
eukprot:EG_transcript_42451